MSEERFRIGLDCDGVLYQFGKTAHYMFARREGFATREEFIIPREDEWDWGLDREKYWEWVLSGDRADRVFRHGHLFSGAIEFVEQLDTVGDVHVLTKRPKDAIQATIDFFSLQKLPLAGLHTVGMAEPKSNYKMDCYIDDSSSNFKELVENTPRDVGVILIDRPYNQDVNIASFDHKVARTFSFDETVEVVDKWAT